MSISYPNTHDMLYMMLEIKRGLSIPKKVIQIVNFAVLKVAHTR